MKRKGVGGGNLVKLKAGDSFLRRIANNRLRGGGRIARQYQREIVKKQSRKGKDVSVNLPKIKPGT